MIFIPSKGRWERVRTLENFPRELLPKIMLIVQAPEVANYLLIQKVFNVKVLALPIYIKTIEPTKKYIWKYCFENKIRKFIILDDDLTFCRRRKGDYKHSRYCNKEEVSQMIEIVYRLLDKYAHVGISERLGNNRSPKYLVENTRYVRASGFNLELIPFNKLKFGRIELMEDYDITLQLLKLGLKSIVMFDFCQEQGQSNSKGGCSSFRNPERQEKAAKLLAKYHPGIVKVVEKETKGGWFNKQGVSKRIDVRIQWKKAYEFGRNK